MIFTRLYDTKLAQTSYLIGCGRTGSALVIDPNRDIEQYVRAAEAEGLAITHVTETHIHADFVSGARELAQRTGAQLYLSDEGGTDWKYAYAGDAGAVLVRDGDTFTVGNIKVEVAHTPGHTPEHISFLITDTAAADEPMGIATGDFVFVGDVGRPDLLERAAGYEGTMEAGARTLFRSLQRFKQYPDWLQVWPGHGAGSACGKGLSAVPHSTVGYERRFNWAVAHDDEAAFVEAVLQGQPEPPRYFAEMKRINKEGPRPVHGFTRPDRLPVRRLQEALDSPALVVDTRHPGAYAAAHVGGTLNIPLNGAFTTWAGWLLPYDRDFYLLVDEHCPGCLDEVVRDLAMIGLDRIAGYFGSAVIDEWTATGGTLQSVPQVVAHDVAGRWRHREVQVVDVRGRTEWDAGHIPGAVHIPLGYLGERLADVPRDRPVVVYCQGGGRSAIAASVLRARGLTNVVNLVGGIIAWQHAGLPVERDSVEADLVGTR